MSKRRLTGNNDDVPAYTDSKKLRLGDSESVPTEASQQKRENEDYTVGWICAIEPEYLAAHLCLDETHPCLTCRPSPNDTNTYILGKINNHNVVIACLPDGSYGTSSAANVATNMLRSFPNVKIGLMVGIGGGAPTLDSDIRLGDIVVSSPGDGKGGVFQHDFGKRIQEQDFQETGFLNRPPTILLAGVMSLKVDYKRKPGSLEKAIDHILEKEEEGLREELGRPDANTDILCRSNFVHPANSKTPCVKACGIDPANLVLSRPERKRPRSPVVHYGLIASGNQLMKDALHRDELAEKWKVLCFEMEAAGLMNDFPCLVVRGICDYSDSHKNKEWQGYAAIAAAAYAKDLLYRIPPSSVEAESRISELVSDINDGVSKINETLQNIKSMAESTKTLEILQSLRVTNPRDDKQRIEGTKGGLLKDSYNWILQNPNFQQWYNNSDSALLWVKGDPGKGKTMLLCGIINELEQSKTETTLLSYYFCQATDSRINSATAVLRGLLYLLISQQPSLVSHVQEEYNSAGKPLFEDANAWFALTGIFANVLQDLSLNTTYLIIDALDECIETDLPKLLDFFVEQSSASSRVKWVVSSRNWSDIEKQLEQAGHKIMLSLELNAESVSTAVQVFIEQKVSQLAQENAYNEKTRADVLDYLVSNANATFLWVALVCQNLQTTAKRNVQKKLDSFPPGLDALYKRMMEQISKSDDAELCKQVLALIALVYRPITLKELVALVEQLEDIADNSELREIISLCGSFLTLQDNTVYFVHQSAKEFLLAEAAKGVFPSGTEVVHYTIFSRSLQVLSKTLQRDIYSLKACGHPIDEVKQPDPDPLASLRYSCIYWVDHLCDSNIISSAIHAGNLQDRGIVHIFLEEKYLCWLEALSLCKSMSKGVASMAKLQSLVQGTGEATSFIKLVYDAHRFIMSHKPAIESSPLQAYASALLFSPTRSLIRGLFQREEPEWITIKPAMSNGWNACLQTLEGHSTWVNSVAFSHDSTRLASASHDSTVKLWDASSGACLQTLEGHSDSVNSVAFSHDSTRLASASDDSTFKLWDASSGVCLQTLEGHSRAVLSVAFSHDSTRLASASHDSTVKLWDASSGACLQTLEGHSDFVNSVAFSHDSTRLASASDDSTVKLWDASSGACLQTLEGHSDSVNSVAFSHDSTRLASASHDSTVKLWDASSGACLQTLEGHSRAVKSVAFSHDSTRLASASYDRTVKLWDASSGACLQTLEVETSTVAFNSTSSHIHTDISRIAIISLQHSDVLVTETQQRIQQSIGISSDRTWITHNAQKRLWLPPEYRPRCSAVSGRYISIGTGFGKVWIFCLK